MRSFMNITIKLLQHHSHDHNHDKLFEHSQVIDEVATPEIIHMDINITSCLNNHTR